MLVRTVGARLSLAVAFVVALALAIVFLIVLPSLERRLVNGRLEQLERTAPNLARQIRDDTLFLEDTLRNAANATGARVILYYRLSDVPLSLSVFESQPPPADPDVYRRDPVALRAAATLRPARGTVTRGGERFAEVAQPAGGDILLLSASLEDSLGSVELVERRLFVGGLVALLVALAAGYTGAWFFTRRIRRLERAAGRIARGHFDEPVVDRSSDELGELARAFELMREQLARLDGARREFIANASHELRTPLFALGGFLELLADEDLDEATRDEFLVTMGQQVERLTALATDLLDLSRLDAGRLHVESSPLDLAVLAGALAREFAALARADEHVLRLERDGFGRASGDEGRVLQIGRILVGNALLHTPTGTVVAIRSGRWTEGAFLEVEDGGPGVEPEDRRLIFERFSRGGGGRASGSGLGLAIADELARLMGGTVELESRPGRTVFRLQLPAAAERGALTAASPDGRADESPRPLSERGSTVST